MGKLIGYARVSTTDQEIGLQIDALIEAGVKYSDIHTDKISGTGADRPGLDKCLSVLNKGDTLIVWRIDRLGRSLRQLVKIINDLKEGGILFKSLQDGAFDTATASGGLMLNIFSSLSEFESQLIKERTRAGLDACKRKGIVTGRPKVSPDNEKVVMANKLYKSGEIDPAEICKLLKISKATFYRYLKLKEK